MTKLTRVGPDHPRVCQGNTGAGPCSYESEFGSVFCSLHGAAGSTKATEKRELRNYRLNSAFADRADGLAKSPGLKNLTDEIALLRVALETIFNGIQNANEMLLYSDKIEKLAKTITSTVESLQKLQEKNKELLSREQVLVIFDSLMNLIVQHVKDPDALLQLAQEGSNVISKGLGCEV